MLKTPKVRINAEYQRLMWLNFSVGLLVAIVVIYGAFLTVIFNEILTRVRQNEPFNFDQLVILGSWGWLFSNIALAVLMIRSFRQDVSSNFYVQLRMSTLSPWQMVWTRLFVAPMMAWISMLIGMVIILAASVLCHGHHDNSCMNYVIGLNPVAFVLLLLLMAVMFGCALLINQLQFERGRHEYQGSILQSVLLVIGLLILGFAWFDVMGNNSPRLFYHQERQPAYQMTQGLILAGFLLMLASKNMAYQLYLKPFNRFVLLAVLVLPWLFFAVDNVFVDGHYFLGSFYDSASGKEFAYSLEQAKRFNLLLYLISVPAIACFVSVICQDNRVHRFRQVLGYLKTHQFAKALDVLPVWVLCLPMVWLWSLLATQVIDFDADSDFVGLALLTTAVLLVVGIVYQIARRLVRVNAITVVLVVMILLRILLLFVGI